MDSSYRMPSHCEEISAPKAGQNTAGFIVPLTGNCVISLKFKDVQWNAVKLQEILQTENIY
jgi:hypothetical protein